MIQIIAGTFGYYNGRKVVPITNADGPQKFDPELEARLVKKGVAKYVDEKPVAPAPAAEPEREPGATSSRRRRRQPTTARMATTKTATTRSPPRSAPQIPSNGFRLQENGR